MDEYKSKSRYYLQTLLKQPGFDKDTTLGDLETILSNTESAQHIDKQLEQPFYNQSKVTFFRLDKFNYAVLMDCTPKALKLFMILAQHMNQSNVIYISKTDLSDIAGMSKPTVIGAIKELEDKGLILAEKGNEGQGEATTYTLNPAVIASGKIIHQEKLISSFWTHAIKHTATVKEKFDNICKSAKETFSKAYEVKDAKLRGAILTQAEITRRDKKLNQSKRASAGHTDSTELLHSSSTHQDFNREHRKNQETDNINMLNESVLTPEEAAFFNRGDKTK